MEKKGFNKSTPSSHLRRDVTVKLPTTKPPVKAPAAKPKAKTKAKAPAAKKK